MAYIAIATLAGQAAIAAAVAGTAPLTLSQMVIGDGNGGPVTPLETQTHLVNQRDEVGIQTISRADLTHPTWVTIDAILDENAGPYTVREIGLLDNNGTLLFVASVPDTDKRSLAQGVFQQLTLGMIVVVSDAAQIVLQVSDTTFVTQGSLDQQLDAWRTNIGTPLRPYWITVESANLSSPPVSPTDGQCWLIAANPSGPWAGFENYIAQWVVRKNAWVIVNYPKESRVSVTDIGRVLRRTGTGWRDEMADGTAVGGLFPEHLAAAATDLPTNPAGVRAMIARFAGEDRTLFHGCF